jgi:hypothetical protein
VTPEMAHTDVAAYALGLLEEPDRRAFEAHLTGCALCNAELAELRGVAAALDGISLVESLPATPATDAAIVTDLVRRRADTARKGRRSHTVLSAAAGVALLAGGVGAGVVASPGDDDPPPRPAAAAPPQDSVQALLASGRRFSGTDPRSGVTGTVAMEPKGWGARIALRLSKVRGPLECELIAVNAAGQRRVVTGWSVPPKGYGEPGAPAPLTVQGGVGIRPADIARFEVRTRDGRHLLTLRA